MKINRIVALLAVVVIARLFWPGQDAAADEPDKADNTSADKVAEVERLTPDMPVAPLSNHYFYLDAIATAPYGDSYSDVYLSGLWKVDCGWVFCGVHLQYEYTRTAWYGVTPWNADSMQLTNKWRQTGVVGNASCSISWPTAYSCTISAGLSSKTIIKTGPTWYDLWIISNEFFQNYVRFDDWLAVWELQERAEANICYYVGTCQGIVAIDSERTAY